MCVKMSGIVILLSFILVGVAFDSGAQDKGKQQKPYDVSVKVQPSATKGSFDCIVVVKDTKTGKEVFTPKDTIKADDRIQASTMLSMDLTLTVTINTDKAGKQATYTFVAEKDDKKIQQDEGKIDIK